MNRYKKKKSSYTHYQSPPTKMVKIIRPQELSGIVDSKRVLIPFRVTSTVVVTTSWIHGDNNICPYNHGYEDYGLYSQEPRPIPTTMDQQGLWLPYEKVKRSRRLKMNWENNVGKKLKFRSRGFPESLSFLILCLFHHRVLIYMRDFELHDRNFIWT